MMVKEIYNDDSKLQVDIEEVQLSFINELENSNISSLQVKSNIMCFVLENGLLFLIDLEKPSKVFKYSIPLVTGGGVKNSEILSRIWLSPNGQLLFIKTNFSNYYVCDANNILQKDDLSHLRDLTTLVKKLSKNNYDINSLEWCSNHSFLCGSNDGHLYFVDAIDDTLKNLSDIHVTTIVKFSKKVDGILWHYNASTNKGECVVASDSKIMCWDNVDSNDPINTLKKRKFPQETEEFDILKPSTRNRFSTFNDRFSWVTNNGVVYGRTELHTRANVDDSKITNKKILKDANLLLYMELPDSEKVTNDILLTEFYLILLRKNSTITVVNRLNNIVVHDEELLLNDNERILGLAADYSQQHPTYWCYSNSHIYEIILQKEAHTVWKTLCEQKEYDTALKLLDIEKIERDMILYYKADDLYKKGEFIDSAENYGVSCYASFGSIAMKFMGSDEKIVALQKYLLTKLETLFSKEEPQKILISSWILWTYLKRLNIIDENIDSEKSLTLLENLKKNKLIIKAELIDFLSDNVESLEKNLVYQLLVNQNRQDELLYYSKLISDYDFILGYWIKKENWYEAQKSLLHLTNVEDIYKYASILMIKTPETVVQTWMKIAMIDPIKLIPSLLTYYSHYKRSPIIDPSSNKLRQNYALTYLEWCVENHLIKNLIIYNTSLYMMITTFDANFLDDVYQERIIEYMKNYENQFDINFVLRLSLKFETINVSIFLYSKLKLFEDAVNLALEHNLIDFAKTIINSIESNVDPSQLGNITDTVKLRKKLAIKVAIQILRNEKSNQDIKTSINRILNDSYGILTIKDLLPIFDDFTTIANLKDQLIKSLELHAYSMSQISQNIKTSMNIKKDLVNDMEYFKERYQSLDPGESCDICKKILQSSKFYVFPCSHCFHENCIKTTFLESNDFILKSRVENLDRKIKRESDKSKKISLKQDLNKLLSIKCCLCSDININKIESYAIAMDNEEESMKWQV